MKALKGLRDLHYAIATIAEDGSVTYAVPKPIRNLQKMGLDIKVSGDKYYADDSIAHIENNFEGCAVQLELLGVGTEEEAELKGAVIDENGVMIDSATDIPPYIALGFRAARADNKYRYVWLTLGKMQPSKEDYQTQEQKKQLQSVALNFEFDKRADGVWRYKTDEDSENAPADLKTKWFEKVYDGNFNTEA